MTTRQLQDLGLDSSQIDKHVARGYLHRIRRGAYAVGRRAIPERGHIRAAVLACGGACIASHHTAANLWRLAGPARPLHLIRGPGGPSAGRGLRYHQVRDPTRVESTDIRGIPVTTVARTIRDLSVTLDLEDLEDLASSAQRLGILSLPELNSVELPSRGRPGARRFRMLLARINPDTVATRSRMERRILRLCVNHGLPRPRTAVNVEGYEVDLLWPAERVIVEFDGRAYHTDARTFERDHRRDARHMAAGYRTFRVTYRMLEEDPEAIVGQIARLLSVSPAL